MQNLEVFFRAQQLVVILRRFLLSINDFFFLPLDDLLELLSLGVLEHQILIDGVKLSLEAVDCG